jgi:hypothetical protein
LTNGLLALALPLCLLAGTPTTAEAAPETCQPQVVTADFSAKATHPTDVPAILPEGGFSVDGGSLTPHSLCAGETFNNLLPGYLTTPSGRSPPLL